MQERKPRKTKITLRVGPEVQEGLSELAGGKGRCTLGAQLLAQGVANLRLLKKLAGPPRPPRRSAAAGPA